MIECELWAFLISTYFHFHYSDMLVCVVPRVRLGVWTGVGSSHLTYKRTDQSLIEIFLHPRPSRECSSHEKEMNRLFCARESKVQLFHWEVQKARSSFCLIVARLCNAGAESRCIQVIVWYSAVQCSTALVIVSREGWGNIDPDPAVMHCTRCTALQRSRLPY